MDGLKAIIRMRKPPYLATLGVKGCNDVKWPWGWIGLIRRVGFRVIAVKSTKKEWFRVNRQGAPFWVGLVGALFGHDIIFLCQK